MYYCSLQEDWKHNTVTYLAHQNSKIMSKYARIPMIEETIINMSGSASGESSWKNKINILVFKRVIHWALPYHPMPFVFFVNKDIRVNSFSNSHRTTA